MSTKPSRPGRLSVLTRLRPPVEVKRTAHVGIGGAPRVSLLPGEIRDAGANARHRRVLVGLVAASAIVAAALIVAASGANTDAQRRLAVANTQTQGLTTQIAKFSDVRALQQRIALGNAGVKVGGSTIIDWEQQIRDIEAEMPSGYTVTAISAAGATPLTDYPQGTTALEPRRAATIMLTVTTPSVGSEYSVWLRKIAGITAYADANATIASAGEGGNTISLTVHLNPKAIIGTKGREIR